MEIPEEKQSITIHQLLTHSSGLPGGTGPDEEPIGKQAFLDRLMAEPLQFDPGSGDGTGRIRIIISFFRFFFFQFVRILIYSCKKILKKRVRFYLL